MRSCGDRGAGSPWVVSVRRGAEHRRVAPVSVCGHARPRHRRCRLHRIALRAHDALGWVPGLRGRRGDGLRQAHLRREPGQPRPGGREPALPVRAGRHLRGRGPRRGAARARRRGQLRRRVPCRPVHHRRGRLRADQRARRAAGVRGRAAAPGAPGRARVHRRGVRVDRHRLLDRGPPAGAELAVLGGQGRQRPDRPGLRADLRAGHLDHPVQQQLRAVPLPGEGHPAVRHQPARRAQGAAVRRGRERPRLAVRRRPLPRHPAGARGGRGGGVLQHRGRTGAVQQGAHREAAGGNRPRLGLRGEHRRPARRRARPPLLRRLLQDRRAGLRPADVLRGRPGADRAVVPGQPRLVGAPQGRGGHRPRMTASVSWLVTGAGGQLGTDLTAVLAGQDVTALGRDRLDLTDEQQVRSVVRGWLAGAGDRRPVVLNAAAYTAVDAAEDDEATAQLVNGAAPGWLAQELAGRGRLVHVSTDYVFDGTATRPYGVDDEPAPRTAYGRTKLAGERAVAAVDDDAVVVRTAWVYAAHGSNFVRTMLRLQAERDTVSVVDDQTGSPTWSADLARGLVAAALSPARGLLHATNAGATTWHGLARLVFELAGADPDRVLPTTTDAFPRPAHRPAYSVLDPASWTTAGLQALPPWQDSVRACLAELGALSP